MTKNSFYYERDINLGDARKKYIVITLLFNNTEGQIEFLA